MTDILRYRSHVLAQCEELRKYDMEAIHPATGWPVWMLLCLCADVIERLELGVVG